MFNEQELAHLVEHVAQYPEPRAGAIFCLYAVQDKVGFINDEGLKIVSELTGLSRTQLEELITFFTLLRRRPAGRNILRICDSISCHTMGSKNLLRTAQKHTEVPIGKMSRDGSVTVLPSICLGLCDQAPAALLNDREEVVRLSSDRLRILLDGLKDFDINAMPAGGSAVLASDAGTGEGGH